MRPIFRWHRRKPVALVLAIYLGVPAVVCLAACLWFLQSGSQPPSSAATASAAPGGPVAIQLGAPAKPALREEILTPDKVSALQLQAEEAFRAGDFATAEALYQKLLPQAKHKAFTGFHLFLCLLQQGKSQEARLLANQATPRTVPKNPVTFYMAAAMAMKAGQPAQAAESISRAHELFPDRSLFYDKALREAGLEPPSTTTTNSGQSSSGG
jgi:tetratricopeptide (TPR) repeat protein